MQENFHIIFWKKTKLFIKYNFYYYIKYFPLKLFKSIVFRYTLRNLNAKKRIVQKINPVVYQTWVTNKFNRQHFLKLIEFRKINPDLTFKLFNDNKMDDYMKNHWSNHKIYEIYNRLIYGPMRSDIFRYCILYEMGGYYFDIDKMCLKSLISLHHRNSSALITFDKYHHKKENNKKIAKLMKVSDRIACQWGMGFKKKHIILASLIKNIIDYYKKFKNNNVNEYEVEGSKFTGPAIFTDTIRKVLKKKIDKNICFLKTNFNGYGVFRIKGSHLRYIWTRPAWSHKNIKLLKNK